MHRSRCVSPDRGSPAFGYGALPRLSAPPRAVTDPPAGPGFQDRLRGPAIEGKKVALAQSNRARSMAALIASLTAELAEGMRRHRLP